MWITNLAVGARLVRTRAFPGSVQWKYLSTVKVGDVVPINYILNTPPLVIKEDKDYPDWLFTIGQPLPSKNELMAKFNTEGADAMTIREKKRLKKLINREKIKTSNTLSASGV